MYKLHSGRGIYALIKLVALGLVMETSSFLRMEEKKGKVLWFMEQDNKKCRKEYIKNSEELASRNLLISETGIELRENFFILKS